MKQTYSTINDFIDDIHNTLSVKETIIQMGIIPREDFKGFFTKCIFHNGDNDPSLQVTDNFFKCYGCGVKGDLISFISHYFNMDFMESVKKIADFLKIDISSVKTSFDSKGNKLKQEWELYLDKMSNASKEIQELKRDYFPQEIGFDDKINYVVFPITSKSGAILGFTKRRIDFLHEKDASGKFKAPKWKHSTLQDSLIGQVHNLFNFYLANPEIKKTGEVILTEGPKDVIGYRRINKNNVVCCCGTQNGNNIWDLLLYEKIVFSLDGDKSGISATIKAILYLSTFFDVRKIQSTELPSGEDPYSVSNLKEIYDNRISSTEFVVKYGNKSQILELYNSVPEYNKTYVLKNICKIKEFNITEAESWLLRKNPNEDSPETETLSEKDNLLALINGDPVLNDKVKYIPIERAKKILRMKYGITFD